MTERKKSRNECLQFQLRKRSRSDISGEIRNRRRSLDEFLGFYNQLVNKDRTLSWNGRRTATDAESESEINNLGNAVRGCLKMLVCKRKAGRDATKNYFQAPFNHKTPIPESRFQNSLFRFLEKTLSFRIYHNISCFIINLQKSIFTN